LELSFTTRWWAHFNTRAHQAPAVVNGPAWVARGCALAITEEYARLKTINLKMEPQMYLVRMIYASKVSDTFEASDIDNILTQTGQMFVEMGRKLPLV
jgi:hypothetical protein